MLALKNCFASHFNLGLSTRKDCDGRMVHFLRLRLYLEILAGSFHNYHVQ